MPYYQISGNESKMLLFTTGECLASINPESYFTKSAKQQRSLVVSERFGSFVQRRDQTCKQHPDFTYNFKQGSIKAGW